jgi:hypothetical protein
MKITDQVANNLFVNGKRVIQRTFTGKEFNKNDIKKLVEQFQKQYANKNLTLMLGVNTPFGFRNSKQFGIHDVPNLVDDYDWDTTNAFIIYGWQSTTAQGGDGENNDCLFQCIKTLLTAYRLPKDLKTDRDMKFKLKLKFNDKVPLDRLPEVEKLYKLNINVVGSHTYTSQNKFNMTMNVKLVNEHFELEEDNLKSHDLLKHVPRKKQNLILVEIGANSVKCYDGEDIFHLDLQEYFALSRDFMGENVYLENTPFQKTDLIADYHHFINEIEILKDLTHGKIDLTQSGYKVSNEALKCIHFSLLAFHEPEELTSLEQQWIMNCFKGGLICQNNTALPRGYNYDKNSAYPSMLCSDHFTFPLKQGQFTKINELPSVLQYGIYHCVIKQSEDEHTNKLFRFNRLNYYTHFDIALARKIGLIVELIQDDESNALLYTKDRGNGANYFRQIVHSLYELKPKSKLAKFVLNSIWGALSQRNKITTTTSNVVDLNKGELLIHIQPYGDKHKIKYLRQGKYFKYPYARLGCFLTSAVRKQMAETIHPYKDHVFRCHTDSLLSDMEIPLLIGTNLGDFKLEKQGQVYIHHSSKALDWN